MRVLAIDPGYDRMGVAVLDHVEEGEVLLFSACVTTEKSLPLAERIHVLGCEIKKLLNKFKPDIVGIETLFFNKNQKTAIGVAQARGMVLYLAKEYGCQVCEYGPQEIKVSVTGYGKSDKAAVIAMVKRLVVGVPEKGLDDEYDAIAVGVTCLVNHRNNSL